MNTFSPTEAIKFGWKTFKANPGFLIGLSLIIFAIWVISFLIGFLIPNKSSSDQILNFVISAVTNVIYTIISLGMINALLKLVNNGKGNFSDIFSEFTNFKLLVNYIVGSILVTLIVLGGFILLIIPGIIFSVRLSQFLYFIVDKNMGPIEAIKASWNATRGNVWNLIGFGFLTGLVEILGLLALGVGLIVATSVTSVAAIYVYKMLSQQKSDQPAPVAPDAPMPATPAMPAT